MTWKIVVLAKLPYYKVNKKVETLVFIYIYIYIYIKPKPLKLPQFSTSAQYLKLLKLFYLYKIIFVL